MMRIRTSSSFLAALALLVGAGTASAQVLASTAPSAVSIAKNAVANVTTTSTVGQADTSSIVSVTVTPGTLPSGIASVVCASGGVIADGTSGSAVVCTYTVDHTYTAHLTASSTPYAFVVPLLANGSADISVTVSVTVTSTLSPLSGGPITLSYISHGVSNQPAAHTTGAISDNDTIADTYTIQSSSVPSWLNITPGTGVASLTVQDTLGFTVVQTPANALSAGLNTASVHLQVTGQPDFVLVVNLTVVVQQPLTTTTGTDTFAYTAGSSSTPAAQTASIAVASGTAAFTLDLSTVPAWLTATASGTATTSGVSVTFTPVASVVKGLAAGNYSGAIGYLAQYATSDLLIPVVLTVSNPTATLSLKGTPVPVILNMPGATIPAPVVTVVSSDEPTSFSATCVVTSTDTTYANTPTSCTLSGNLTPAATVTGIAYTYGTSLTTTFDPTLFTSKYGAVITETVTVTGGAASPVHQTFTYTLQPIAPTFTALSPTSAAQITANALVVTLTGTNFVGPGSIIGSAISPTKVFVGTTNETANSVVINSNTIMVSVPFGDFPAYPTGKTTVNMVIGVANHTGATAPSVPSLTQNLVVTNAPVIYAVTSTASYLQPSPGARPKVVPYELVSIFGANFFVSPTASASGTLSSFYQFGTSVTSGTGTGAVTLSVSFKSGATTVKAPILFANATQINLAVPVELTIGQLASVTVTSGSAVSDGLFTVNVVAADAGIFTLSSQGTGPGAILNADYSVNSGSNPAASGSSVSIYMTGLGIPNSVGLDNSANSASAPAGCVVINGTTSSPGYLQVANTKTSTYTPPTPAWTNLDGVAVNQALLLGHSFPPCFTTAVTVTFGSGGSSQTATATYAGFVSGSVAGLYQINVTVPTLATGTYPVTVTLGGSTSPAGVVTMAVQ